MSALSAQYIAGFFDGEGSVYNKNAHTGGVSIRISIPQTNEDILLKIKDFFGFGIVRPVKKRKENWKDAWTYVVHSNEESLKFLISIKNYVEVKKENVNRNIEILEKWFDKKGRFGIEENNLYLAISLYKSGIGYKLASKRAGVYNQRESVRSYLLKNNLMRHAAVVQQ